MKKLALLLFGMHYNPTYTHVLQGGVTYSIDYRVSFDNYKKFIFDYFYSNNYSIDTYISTYESDITQELLKDYSPKKYILEPFRANKQQVIARNSHFISAIDLCLQNPDIHYDLILITRFDLLFQIPFNQINIQTDKLNLVSILEKPNYIDDNLYILPFNKLESLQKVAIRNRKKMLHYTYPQMNSFCGEINFLYNEPGKFVYELSFYKIAGR
jgi:hypothetical protein